MRDGFRNGEPSVLGTSPDAVIWSRPGLLTLSMTYLALRNVGYGDDLVGVTTHSRGRGRRVNG